MAQQSEGAAELSEQIKALQAELLALTEQFRGFSTAKAQAGAEAVREAAERASGTARATAAEARRHGEQIADELEGRITANPLPAVLIAAGVGLLVGAIFSRR